MKKLFVLVTILPLIGACVTRTYERDTVVEKPNTPSTVVVPQGSTSSGTTVVVPQNAPPSGETTIVVPR